ncbi:MAG: hypothetical protein M3N95_04375 [Actinomycetota bacterium]|nr:hypothetical protein [Actinomycetota bacterium]
MTQSRTASIVNQPHAQLADDVQAALRARPVRLPRPGTRSVPGGRRLVFAPIDAFRQWLAAGML